MRLWPLTALREYPACTVVCMVAFRLQDDTPKPWREITGHAKHRRRPPKVVQQPDDPAWAFHPQVIDGQICYRIGNLAAALGVSTQSIRYWIRKGYLPETHLFRYVPGAFGDWRYYTVNEIHAAVRIAGEENMLGKNRWNLKESSFGMRVAEAWARLHGPQLSVSVPPKRTPHLPPATHRP